MTGPHCEDSDLFALKQNQSIDILVLKMPYTIHVIKIENQVLAGDHQIERKSFEGCGVQDPDKALGYELAGQSLGPIEKFSHVGYGHGVWRIQTPGRERTGQCACGRRIVVRKWHQN